VEGWDYEPPFCYAWIVIGSYSTHNEVMATHLLSRLVNGVDPHAELIMTEIECELSGFFKALQKVSIMAAQQGKFLAVQAQYTRPGIAEIVRETDKTDMRRKLQDLEVEGGLRRLFQIRLTNVDPVSAQDAHKLETFAQRCLMLLTSYDGGSVIYQCYNASAVNGMSVLSAGDILGEGDRSMVVTLTMLMANPGATAQPSPARTDSVFGPNRFKVC